jgi:5-methyltetrahydrofolate--homocysteine methyltransferase
MMNLLEKLLSEHRYLVADGGTGTVLMGLGLTQGDPPEGWNLAYPERIRHLHRSYIEAGSQIILTNSFGGTRFRLKLHNWQDKVHEINLAAAKLARAEADAAGRPVVVAGSIGPSGEIFEPLGSLSFEDAKAGFAEQAAALAEGGVDAFWIETMSALEEVQAAVEGVRAVSDLPVVTTMTFDTRGRTMMGISPEQALQHLRALGPLAIGGNCGNGVAEIESVIQKMYATDQSVPLVAKSNAGIPEFIDGAIHYSAGPAEMADYAVKVRSMGARIIGGCCGSSPEHVRAMVAKLKATPFEQPVIRLISSPEPAKRKRESRRPEA